MMAPCLLAWSIGNLNKRLYEKKLKEHNFPKFLMFEKTKYSKFLNLGSETDLQTYLIFEDGTLLTWLAKNVKTTISKPLSKNLENLRQPFSLNCLKFEKQSPFIFFNLTQGLRYDHFFKFHGGTFFTWWAENEKMAISHLLSKN